MAINLVFQKIYILNPWYILFHPTKIPWKVFSILLKVRSACCGLAGERQLIHGTYITNDLLWWWLLCICPGSLAQHTYIQLFICCWALALAIVLLLLLDSWLWPLPWTRNKSFRAKGTEVTSIDKITNAIQAMSKSKLPTLKYVPFTLGNSLFETKVAQFSVKTSSK